jgi:hypothetical protein
MYFSWFCKYVACILYSGAVTLLSFVIQATIGLVEGERYCLYIVNYKHRSQIIQIFEEFLVSQ